MGTGERAVLVGKEKLACGIPMKVLESLGEFRVIDLGVETTQHHSDVRVWCEIS